MCADHAVDAVVQVGDHTCFLGLINLSRRLAPSSYLTAICCSLSFLSALRAADYLPPNPVQASMADVEKKAPLEDAELSQVEQLRTKDSAEAFIPPTPEEERAVIRKLDWRLLPLVFVLYSLSVLDRSNLG